MRWLVVVLFFVCALAFHALNDHRARITTLEADVAAGALRDSTTIERLDNLTEFLDGWLERLKARQEAIVAYETRRLAA